MTVNEKTVTIKKTMKYRLFRKDVNEIVRIDRVKLTAQMAKLDMSGKMLSIMSGLSRGTITGVKSGKSCSQETGEKIARALGVDVSELVEGARA